MNRHGVTLVWGEGNSLLALGWRGALWFRARSTPNGPWWRSTFVGWLPPAFRSLPRRDAR